MPKNAKIFNRTNTTRSCSAVVLVNKLESNLETRKIAIYGTGNPIPRIVVSTLQNFSVARWRFSVSCLEVN